MSRLKKHHAHLAKARAARVNSKARRVITDSTFSSDLEQSNGDLGNCIPERTEQDFDDSGLRSEESSSEESNYESNSEEATTDESDESDSEQSIADDTADVRCSMTSRNVPILECKEGGEESLKRPYGLVSSKPSRSTVKRQRRHQRELEHAASNTYKIADLFKRQQDLGMYIKNEKQCTKVSPAKKTREKGQEERTRQLAQEDMEKLLNSKKAQIKKYGHLLFPRSDFYRRHCMVRSFLYVQMQKSNLSLKKREMAEMVAPTYNRRGYTAKKLLKWVKSWVEYRNIPESKAGKHRACASLLEDEGVHCAIRDFAKTQGEGKHMHSSPLTWINS